MSDMNHFVLLFAGLFLVVIGLATSTGIVYLALWCSKHLYLPIILHFFPAFRLSDGLNGPLLFGFSMLPFILLLWAACCCLDRFQRQRTAPSTDPDDKPETESGLL